MGLPVSFISEYGAEDVGDIIDNFLNSNGVNTKSVHRFEDGKTTLALAFLNEKNDAHYSFYKDYPSRRLNTEFPHLQKDDILQYGSFYAIWTEIRTQIKKFVQSSHDAGALVVYDPNFRKSHLDELSSLKPLIVENMRMASLVRGSDEDFKNIFRVNSPDEAWDVVRNYCKCLVYTASTEGVYVRTESFSGKFPVKTIVPVSTIGAGDNFNAGMITSIYRNNLSREQLSEIGQKEWSSVIETAVSFATHVCLSYENYISEEFAGQIINK
jgi:fructokinase